MFWQLNAKERIGYAILALLVLSILAVLGYRASRTPTGGAAEFRATSPVPPLQKKEPQQLVVHVVGAVKKPGVYKFSSGARAQDALQAAGGPSSDAATDAVNLAAPLSDGEQVRVPQKGEASPIGAAVSSSPGAPIKGKLSSGTVSLNSASLEQLQQIPGVGPATAQKILAYRSSHGGFSSVDQIRNVGGIGDKKFAKMSAFLKL